MPHRSGRHRRLPGLPVARLLALGLALTGAVLLFVFSPIDLPIGRDSTPLARVPTWTGPEPERLPGTLADGTAYQPRIFLAAGVSAGLAPTTDGRHVRVLLRTATRLTELHRLPAADHPQFEGFVASGDDLVWAESLSPANAPVRTSIWRANWRSGARPVVVTVNAGEADFFQSQHDLVVERGRVHWVAVGSGDPRVTEVRSVPLRGGPVQVARLAGEFALSTWPWAVSDGGHSTPARLVNLSSGQRVEVATKANEIASCSPKWCRITVLGDASRRDGQVIRIDLQRADGKQRRRIAGNEATFATTDVAVLDRFVPLATDPGRGEPDGSVGLSLYDITTSRTDLVAVGVADVQARHGVLWWSTGSAATLTWYALDLRALG